jgi:cephalosporin hydroxylase
MAMEKFKHLVSVNSYFIIEDGALNHIGLEREYGGGPLKAISEFLPNNPNFQIDRKWCDFFGKNATFNPNGYIKRIY